MYERRPISPHRIERRRRTAVVLLLSGLALSACQTTSGLDAQTRATEAKQQRRALILSPRFMAAAQAALSERRFDEAKQRFGQIIAADPKQARAKLGLAEAFLASGESGKAVALFHDLGAIASIRPLALEGEGLALMRQDRIGAARERLTAAVSADGRLWRAWNALGQIHDRQGRYVEAESAYMRALTLTDDQAFIRNNLGFSYMLQGRYPEAERQLLKALAADGSLAVAKENLRLALAWQGRYVDAMAGVRFADRARILNNIGYIAMLRGEYGRAEAYYTRAMVGSAQFYRVAARNLEALHELTARPEQTARTAATRRPARGR